jgi:hypothetical protein
MMNEVSRSNVLGYNLKMGRIALGTAPEFSDF